jgi:hypothetical protein
MTVRNRLETAQEFLVAAWGRDPGRSPWLVFQPRALLLERRW